jgi:hypothetical protein
VPPAVLDASLDQRFLAAVLLYGQAALATVATLNVIRQAADKGHFELSQTALTRPVVLTAPMVRPITAARLTPVDQLTGYASAPPETAAE